MYDCTFSKLANHHSGRHQATHEVGCTCQPDDCRWPIYFKLPRGFVQVCIGQHTHFTMITQGHIWRSPGLEKAHIDSFKLKLRPQTTTIRRYVFQYCIMITL